MSDVDAILQGADACEARDEPYALATVVSVRGSSYRRPGARLLVPRESTPIGLVSGGCLEDEAARMTREALQRDLPILFTIDHSKEGDEIWGSGLGCRGILELLAEPPRLAAETIDALRNARHGGARRILLTSFDGERSRLSPDEAAEFGEAARTALEQQRPVRIGEAVLDPIFPPPHLVICGAGPDAPALVRAATGLGWRVTVADPRRKLLAAADIEPATRLEAEPREAAQRIGLEGVSAVVIMGHNYLRDAEYMRAFGGQGVPYVGLLGPRDRTDRMLSELAVDGFELTDADRAALHAPAGLDVGADGPEEVALAIVAEILAALRDGSAAPLRDRPGPIHATRR